MSERRHLSVRLPVPNNHRVLLLLLLLLLKLLLLLLLLLLLMLLLMLLLQPTFLHLPFFCLSLRWIKISCHLISELVTLINFLANASAEKVSLQVVPTAENSNCGKSWQFLKHIETDPKGRCLDWYFCFLFRNPRKNPSSGCQVMNVPKCFAQLIDAITIQHNCNMSC